MEKLSNFLKGVEQVGGKARTQTQKACFGGYIRYQYTTRPP